MTEKHWLSIGIDPRLGMDLLPGVQLNATPKGHFFAQQSTRQRAGERIVFYGVEKQKKNYPLSKLVSGTKQISVTERQPQHVTPNDKDNFFVTSLR